jgi:hypothetical protein
MGWTVRGSNPGGSEIFLILPDRFWVPYSLIHWVLGLFLGVTRPGMVINTHPQGVVFNTHPQMAPGLKKEEMYTCTPLGLYDLL